MPCQHVTNLVFRSETVNARTIDPLGMAQVSPIQIRIDPITGRTCRITFSRIKEKEAGTGVIPEPPPSAADTADCPFCRPQVWQRTPTFPSDFCSEGRMRINEAILFPNLYPYGAYSAVSLFDNQHYVEIGTASQWSYTDSFINCRNYLGRVFAHDSEAVYHAITQNHLPSAGGSLIHPHLQVHADRMAANHFRTLMARAHAYLKKTGRPIFSDYLDHEKGEGSRYIGGSGPWEWVAAFAPEGFFEIWGICPGRFSFRDLSDGDWGELSAGVMKTQRFYRSLHRNGYNLGLISAEVGNSPLELRIRVLVRANYAPWVRNDITGYEVMLGDVATFTAPERTAEMARPFWAELGDGAQ